MNERVYLRGRNVAHLTSQGTITSCRLYSPAGFWGTGSQDEYEKAAQLPLCRACGRAEGVA